MDFDCAFMKVLIENQKMALTSIAHWFTSKERPLQFTSNTILLNRAEVATSVDNLAINFELLKSAESKSDIIFSRV